MTTAVVDDDRSSEVRRKIYFFRPDAGTDEHRRLVTINFLEALRRIHGLGFNTSESGRYLEQPDENVLCGWIDSDLAKKKASDVLRMRFALIRKNALPQSESGGVLSDILTDENSGICETAHVCFFPEGIVGIDFNFFGPRPTKLATYLSRVGNTTSFAMEALLRQDVAEQLAQKRALRRFTLRVRRSEIAQIETADRGTGRALRAAAEASDAQSVGIILEPEPHQRTNLRDGMLDVARRILALPGSRTNFREFEVKAVDDDSPKVTTMNLLEDKLVSEVTILKQHSRSRVLDPNDAYAKIESTFTALRAELLSAMSANVDGE